MSILTETHLLKSLPSKTVLHLAHGAKPSTVVSAYIWLEHAVGSWSSLENPA